MSGYTRNVLVVATDTAERERLATALEGDGFEAELCPGPAEPEDACIGARLGRCPLARDPCVVVLDMDLGGDGFAQGKAAEDLLDFYLATGHRVVALSSRSIAGHEDRCLRVRRHPETEILLAAVWSSASQRGRGGGGGTDIAGRQEVSASGPAPACA
ncbi:MAG TPA: hypothetical protein VKC55_08845 [Actinomycetota bacterium]|nr:hypothetical protein [Actinomycetota bacterium]